MSLEHKLPVIRNDKGERIVLNASEKFKARWLANELYRKHGPIHNSRHLTNSLGYEVQITTLTTIMKRITQQKFFEIPPADYVPVRVGEGTWSTNLTTYRSFDVADAFETGIINTGGENSRLASADAGVDALNIKVFPWAKSIGWSIFDLEFAESLATGTLLLKKRKRENETGTLEFKGLHSWAPMETMARMANVWDFSTKLGSRTTQA
jgi:hypothetical protein